MRRPPATAPEARPADSAHAAAASMACGVALDARLHSGEIVDVFRGRLLETPRLEDHRARFTEGDGRARFGEAPREGRSLAPSKPVRVAAKVTREHWRGHPGAIELLAREHRVLSVVDHPHIVRARGFAEEHGVGVLVTEYLPGGDLVPLAGAEPCRWVPAARAVAAALDALHRAGFVHGDVKARNVLFDAAGRAILIDLGSARRIGRPRASGGRTRAHEPLRFELREASRVEDVFAFAVLLYELMTGRLPFGSAPVGWAPPAPVEIGRSPELRGLAARVMATLEAASPAEAGTLIEFADVLESVHGKAAEPV